MSMIIRSFRSRQDATDRQPQSCKLSVKYHPDKNKGNKEAEEKFQLINNAYEVLENLINASYTMLVAKKWLYKTKEVRIKWIHLQRFLVVVAGTA